ncbi:hypothetical protein CDAR_206041 [Caerostris darwini]|uniref:Uncharacterized protein n=1 Tax=Caerostris darwini TaxID=1538125 RepID=A0AAV4VWL3_9ARAC|nr:hypothetical protein CDAR_206041 [Caerostris darwini]
MSPFSRRDSRTIKQWNPVNRLFLGKWGKQGFRYLQQVRVVGRREVPPSGSSGERGRGIVLSVNAGLNGIPPSLSVIYRRFLSPPRQNLGVFSEPKG